MRNQLLVAARRAGKTAIARLVAIAPERLIVTYTKPVPTLKEFREERDPHEMFSEAELIELFQEEYGSGTRNEAQLAVRNARLRTKQHAALRQLEVLVASDPKLSDGVDGWLDPALATRLKAANIVTLQHFVDAINGFGYRW